MADSDADKTSRSLLRRLRESTDEENDKNEFSRKYWPMIRQMAESMGLQAADADDLAQDVIMRLFRGFKHSFKYDEKKGRFRGYVRTCVRNAVKDSQDSHKKRLRGSGDSKVLEVLNNLKQETLLLLADKICDDDIFQQALHHVRIEAGEEKFRVFEAVKLLGLKPTDVAADHNLSRGNVDVIVFRITKQLAEAIRELDDDEIDNIDETANGDIIDCGNEIENSDDTGE
jgi:RNA polymerase sigma-70 factor, ECF subfamily